MSSAPVRGLRRFRASRSVIGGLLALGAVAACAGVGAGPALAAGPVHWEYPVMLPFAGLQLAGVGLDEYGRLVPGLDVAELLLKGPEIVWCAVSDGEGGLYAGSGHGGQVWRVPQKGEPAVVTTLPEPEIFALARARGELYAGGGPEGVVYRIPAKGEPETWADLPEQYVWALATGPDGRLYAATGSPAAVYRIDGQGKFTKLAALPAQNALDLEVGAGGRLLATTQGPGLILQIDLAGKEKPRVLYEAPQDEIRHLAIGPNGDWYALAIAQTEGPGAGEGSPEPGSATPDSIPTPMPAVPKSGGGGGGGGGGAAGAAVVVTAAGGERCALYRIAPDGAVTLAWSGAAPLLAVAWTARWGWLGTGARGHEGGSGAIWALDPPQGARPLATWEGGEPVTMVAIGEANAPALYVTRARPGGIASLTARPAEGASAVAPPIDGVGPIRWGRLRWEGEAPGGARVQIAVRGGARATPDSTWSDWSAPWSDHDHAIALPPSRFLQWRVVFTGAGADAWVDEVSVSGYKPNEAPRIVKFELQSPGELKAGGAAAGGGNVIETFRGGLKAEYSVDQNPDRRVPPLEAEPVRAVRTFTWQGWDPDGDRLTYKLEYQRVGEKSWRAIGEESADTVRGWNTGEVPDGRYVLRLTVSDRSDNRPDEALVASEVSPPLLVDHTPPRIQGFKVQRTRDGFRVSFAAQDDASPLASAWLELPDGTAVRLDPVDGVCDSPREEFDWSLPYPITGKVAPAEPWQLRVGVVDASGNVATEEGEAR